MQMLSDRIRWKQNGWKFILFRSYHCRLIIEDDVDDMLLALLVTFWILFNAASTDLSADDLRDNLGDCAVFCRDCFRATGLAGARLSAKTFLLDVSALDGVSTGAFGLSSLPEVESSEYSDESSGMGISASEKLMDISIPLGVFVSDPRDEVPEVLLLGGLLRPMDSIDSLDTVLLGALRKEGFLLIIGPPAMPSGS